MKRSRNFYKARARRARCKQVMVILNNRIETVVLVREEIHPPVGDLGVEPLEFAVVRWLGLEVFVPLECVIFLSKLPPEPQWIQEARAKIDKELVFAFRSGVKRPISADRDEARPPKGGRRRTKQK